MKRVLSLPTSPVSSRGLTPDRASGIASCATYPRTAVLVHLLDAGGLSGRQPLDDYRTLNRELRRYDEHLLAKQQIVVANKVDLLSDRGEVDELKKTLKKDGITLHLMSAVSGEGVKEVVSTIASVLRQRRKEELAESDRHVPMQER